MKVYVVTNQCLTHNSSYYEVVAVYDSLIKAQAFIGTNEIDFLKNLESDEASGIDNPDFNTRNLSINETSMELSIMDNATGMFSVFTITAMEIM